MTKRKPCAVRGRPPRDDELIACLAVALQVAWSLSERRAVDLALAWLDGEPQPPTKVPRGGRRKGGVLVGYRLAQYASFPGRAATIRRKLVAADPRVVRALVRALVAAGAREEILNSKKERLTHL